MRGRFSEVSVLLFTFPVTGHVTPMLPVVRALVDGGARVSVAADGAFATGFADARAEVVAHPPGFAERHQRPSDNFLEVAAQLAAETAGPLLAFALEQVDRVRPTVILVDSMAPWGRLAAELRGIPTVTSTPSFLVDARLGAAPRAALDAARQTATGLAALRALVRQRRTLLRRYGVDCGGPMTLLSNRGAATIVHTSRELQPGAERCGPEIHFVGATAADRPEPAAGAIDPALAAILARADDPAHRLAYVSLGTIYNERPAFLRDCIASLSGPERSVVVSLGDGVSTAELGPLPAGVAATPKPPQLAVLDRASVFVTHGGLNSVHEALWRGVPMIVHPQAADQPVVADRLRRLGAAMVLRGRNPGAERITAAADALRQSGAGKRAAELGDGLRAGGGATAAAEVVFSLSPGSGSARPRSPQGS